MFANMAHGGATLAGEAWDVNGINTALGEDYGSNLNLVDKNGNPKGSVSGTCPSFLQSTPLGNLCSGQVLFHGDHTGIDSTTGGGTNDGANSNLGAPLFNGWPQWSSTTHQQVYYKWLERAWLGGLRLMVMDAVTNEALCKSSTRISGTDCTMSMPAIDAQLAAAQAFQTWLDTQYGGAGNGWFQIATSAQQAASIIQQGKLAVVLGIEVDNLFNCHVQNSSGQAFNGEGPACTEPYILQQLQKYYGMGVRHIFPIHNFDNAYGSPATWQDPINAGNIAAEGIWWDAVNCTDPGYGFYLDPVTDGALYFLGFGGTTQPDYQSPPWASCHNAPGLTTLGQYLLQQAMQLGMIIDVDHMSINAFNDTITLAQQNNYAGIAVTHVQAFDLYSQNYLPGGRYGRHERMRTMSQLQSIAKLGGIAAMMLKDDVQDTGNGWCVAGGNCPFGASNQFGGSYTLPYNGSSGQYNLNNNCRYSTTEWAQAYAYGIDTMGGPVAMGSDFNGIAGHIGPRFGSGSCGGAATERSAQELANNRLVYPFTLQGFGTFNQQVTGQRTFDFNTDGLAHIGLLPDMVADLKNIGLTDAQLQPLFGSAQAYINMWSKVGKVAPQITSANSTTFNVSVNGVFQVTANADPAASYSETGTLPSGVTFATTGLLSGVPAAGTEGSYTITITATNGIPPSTTQSFTLTVGPPPSITSPNVANFQVGQSGSFIVTASSSVRIIGGALVASPLGGTGTLPNGLTFDGFQTISGTPVAGTGGTYPVRVILETFTNGMAGELFSDITIVVGQAPAITSSNTLSLQSGVAGSLLITTSGYPQPTLSITGALPSGVDANPATGLIAGTPTANASGNWPITITASNGVGNAAKQTLTIVVDQAAAVTSINNATFTAGAFNTFTMTATGFPAPTIIESNFSAQPSGLTFDNTGKVSGTPPLTAIGKYTWDFTATSGSTTAVQHFTLYIKANPVITWNTPATVPYGGAVGSAPLTATANVPGTFAYTPVAGTILSLGSQLLAATFTPTDPTKYFTGTSEVKVQVNQATPKITWPTPTAITYGTPLSTTQLSATATVPGTFTYSPAIGAMLSPGTQTLSVTFAPTDTVHYTKATANVTITVNKAVITVTGNNVSRMYGLANPALTANYSGFVSQDTVSVLTGAPSITTAATPVSLPGTYPIVVTQGTLSAANYTFTFVNGNFTVMPTGVAPPSGTTCNGAYSGTFQGDVQVSSGQTCIFATGGGLTGNLVSNGGNVTLAGATVGKNLTANGGSVTITGGSVGGNLVLQTGATVFNIGPSTIIGNNLQVMGLPTNSVQSTICGVTVGNLQFQNNGAPAAIGQNSTSCPGNQINGDLLIQTNSGSIIVNGNTISGNLNDMDNTGPEQILNNKMNGKLQCSGNSSITGSGNTASSKGGQCAAF